MPLQIASANNAATQGRRVYVATASNAASEAQHLYLAQGPDSYEELFVHPDAPTINSFTSTVAQVRDDQQNQPTTTDFAWNVAGVTRITLTETLADGTTRTINHGGNAYVRRVAIPSQDATYTLTAKNAAGQTSTARVSIRHAAAPAIGSFTWGVVQHPGTPPIARLRLSWGGITGNPAPRLTVASNNPAEGGIPDPNHGTSGGAGHIDISRAITGSSARRTTYTLRAANAAGNTQRQVVAQWP